MAEPSTDTALVLVAAITAVPATIGAVAALVSAKRAKVAKVEARAANAAVNNREANEPGIYDLAREAAANSRDAVRRCAELEGGQQALHHELSRVADIAVAASASADANREILSGLAAEHRELIEEHRRRWAIDEAGRQGTINRRRRRWRS